MRVLIDGRPVSEREAAVSVFDWGLLRGFGVFEVVRIYGSAPFRLDAHLERLERSASALGVPMPGRGDLVEWTWMLAGTNGEGHVRLVLTGGSRDHPALAPSRSVLIWEPNPSVPVEIRVIPMAAPWHPGADAGGFPGVKWTSYAPNMAATDTARRAGFDDALLIDRDGIVLEGPTFTVAWTHEGRLETPSLDLGILHSITREVVLECAEDFEIPVAQGHFPVGRMRTADEAFALSTLKEIRPIVLLGDTVVPTGPVTSRLAAAFAEKVAAET
ncbi:MAG: aminotransferase class IV [Acidimicrobiia bacterium]